MFLHEESVNVLCWGLLGVCWDLSGLVRSLLGLVGTCWDFYGVCQDLWGFVGICRDLSGVVGYVDFMESHFEGIAIVVYKILAKFPIPRFCGVSLNDCISASVGTIKLLESSTDS